MTKPTEAQKADYYLISHGLYFRPEACGYTGIRDEAGLFDKSYAEDYSKNGDPVMVHKDDEKMAPEFMPAAYNDLVINHLKKQRDDALRTARAQQDAERLREVRRQAEKIRETDTDGLPMWTFRATQGFADRQITLLDSIINESNANAGKDG